MYHKERPFLYTALRAMSLQGGFHRGFRKRGQPRAEGFQVHKRPRHFCLASPACSAATSSHHIHTTGGETTYISFRTAWPPILFAGVHRALTNQAGGFSRSAHACMHNHDRGVYVRPDAFATTERAADTCAWLSTPLSDRSLHPRRASMYLQQYFCCQVAKIYVGRARLSPTSPVYVVLVPTKVKLLFETMISAVKVVNTLLLCVGFVILFFGNVG